MRFEIIFSGVLLITLASCGSSHDAPSTIIESGGEGILTIAGTEPFVAGEQETYEFTFTVGPSGLGPGGGFKLLDPILHGIRFTHFGEWTTNPAECRYQYPGIKDQGLLWAEVEMEDVNVTIDRHRLGDNIHQQAYTTVTVDGYVPEGTKITLWAGKADPTPLGPANPLCSTRAPSRAFEHIPFLAASRQHADAEWTMLDSEPPVMKIHPNTELHDIRVILPSMAVVGEPITIRVVMLDEFGNAMEDVTGSFWTDSSLPINGLPEFVEWPESGKRIITLQGVPKEDGVLRIEIVTDGGFEAMSNPCLVSAQRPEVHLYWGDIHAHHGISHLDSDGAIVDENLEYARDVAGLDFGGETMKLPPLEVDWETLWQDLQTSCSSYESPDFVPILGFEWMGPTGYGHHNAYFNTCIADVTYKDKLSTLDEEGGLWEFLDKMQADNPGLEAITVPHASKYTGYGWESVNNRYRPVAEIYSGGWGESIEPDGEKSVIDGILAGNTMGFIASSDDHHGFLGNPVAGRLNSRGGLVGVLTQELNRQNLFTALRDRHTIATVVQRIIALMWTQENGYQAKQGDVLVGFNPSLSVEVHSTQELKSIRLHRINLGIEGSDEVVKEWTYNGGEMDAQLWLAPGEPGIELDRPAAFYIHVEEKGIGQAWTSPIYLYPDCDADFPDPAGLCAAGIRKDPKNTSNYDKELSLSDERGITKSSTKKPSSQEAHMEEDQAI